MGKLVQLAEELLAKVKQYEDVFESNGSPVPSFDNTSFPGPPKQQELESSDHVTKLRSQILSTGSEISALVQGAAGLAMSNINGTAHHAALHMLYRYSVPAHVPLDGSYITYEELSKRCALNLSDLKRIVRYAIACYIFTERNGSHIAHTATSKAFAAIPIMQEWSGMVCEELWPATVKLTDAVTKWPCSQAANQSGFQIAHATEEAMFTSISKDVSRINRFQKTMIFVGTLPIFDPEYLIPIYAWSSKKVLSNNQEASLDNKSTSNVKLVDIGGSHGRTSFALASATPNLECIVQDLPDTIAQSAGDIPADLADRVTFMAHDFFTQQPVIGADIYFLRWILHDWSDEKAIEILRALIPALKPGARVLLNEFTVPLSSDARGGMNDDRYAEKIVRGFDLLMWAMANGKERDPEELKVLFEQADPRFEWLGFTPAGPTGVMGLGEAVWRGE